MVFLQFFFFFLHLKLTHKQKFRDYCFDREHFLIRNLKFKHLLQYIVQIHFHPSLWAAETVWVVNLNTETWEEQPLENTQPVLLFYCNEFSYQNGEMLLKEEEKNLSEYFDEITRMFSIIIFSLTDPRVRNCKISPPMPLFLCN